ncbi:MAG: gamma-glutamyl-gamma-aminobutyrate hydrolase family protein [Ruminococcaceae bacterium]|nr:gamma-glutamyl-gamma-aminobutyrate hydrolase family protein [Oscillospiraceae bacterium]
MKPVIAILAELDDKLNSNLRNTYVKAIEKSGGVPILLPYVESRETIEELAGRVDGFLFSGGCDIDPIRYGEEKSPSCGRVDRNRDALEFKAFDLVMSTSKPILGICRGAQLINVALGGTLYQDIASEVERHVCHEQTEPRDMPSHEVKLIPDTPLSSLMGAERIPANSFHHQAVKRIGEGLDVMATADDGIIEAFYMPSHVYLRAYQWHPERLFSSDKYNPRIFGDFIEACRICQNKE